ncbi:hypothetical protein [Streptomyces sp. NPDC000878]
MSAPSVAGTAPPRTPWRSWRLGPDSNLVHYRLGAPLRTGAHGLGTIRIKASGTRPVKSAQGGLS